MSKNNMRYQRGDVYLVEEHLVQGHEQKKTRPWVLVGASAINLARSTVVAIPLSSSAPAIPPLSIKLYFNNLTICAVLDQIRAINKKRFIHFEGQLTLPEMDLIDDSLRQILAL